MVQQVVLPTRAGAGQVLRTLLVASVACLAAVSTLEGQAPEGGQATATVITGLKVLRHSGGATVVEIAADGPFTADSARYFHLSGELPRGVLRIRGITSRYRPYTTEVGDANVHRIRAGHHPEFDPPELHLVFDLVSDSVRISELARDGHRLRVHLSDSGRRSSVEEATPAPASTPTPRPTATPPATATPRPTTTPTPAPASTPTPRPTATPSATPTARAAATPTPAPAATSTPAPTATRAALPTATASPTAAREPEATGSAASPSPTSPPKSSNYRVWGDSRPPLREQGYQVRREPARTVTEIVTSDRGDGSSVLRITANGEYDSGSFRHLETVSDPLRDILLIRGVEISASPLNLDVEDPNLEQVELTLDRESRPPYLRVELRFTGPAVQVERVTAQGRHLVVLLSRR